MVKPNTVYNEWDPLEEVIIGRADNARFPDHDLIFSGLKASERGLLPAIDYGNFKIPARITEETEEDISIIVDDLRKLGIVVRRPDPIDPAHTFKTPFWEGEAYLNYCPRDIMLAIGDFIIETPNVVRSRYFETFTYRKILKEIFKNGKRWVSAPKPLLTEDQFDLSGKAKLILKETEPMFDAANVLRAGEDIFYLVSNTGNKFGLEWLQSLLGSDYRVHACDGLYPGVHIDSTICLLRPGLVMINPQRVNEANLPPLLKQWKVLTCPPMKEYSYSELPTLSSPWLGMNLLMIRPDLALVDRHQTDLIRLLEANGINVMPRLLRHGRTLGGGFHCISLDVRRSGPRQRYFA